MSRPIEIENSWSVEMSFFKGVETFSTVEMSFFKVLRSRISIETKIKIETNQDFIAKTLSRCNFSNCREFLDSRDFLFQSVEKVSTVETYFFQVSRLRLSIETTSRLRLLNETTSRLRLSNETTSRQIDTPRLSSFPWQKSLRKKLSLIHEEVSARTLIYF